MKLLYDFLPIVLFFVAYKVADIFVATAVAIVAALTQVTVSWIRHRRVETLHLVSAALIAILGGATLALHDKSFIMWKPTLVYLLFAGVFVTTQALGRPLIQRLLGGRLRMPDPAWRRLGWMWVAFFLVCGTANAGMVEYYARAERALAAAAPAAAAPGALDDLDCAADFRGDARALCERAAAREALWVNFKLFGLIALTLLFVIAQSFWLVRHAEALGDDASEDAGDGERPCSTRS